MDEKTPDDKLRRDLNFFEAMQHIRDYAQRHIQKDGSFIVDESQVRHLHSISMGGLLEKPGVYRDVEIKKLGDHKPPPATSVRGYMADFINHLNRAWKSYSVVGVGAYALWRLNWIHPFVAGNGRTARLFSYFLMTMRAGDILSEVPGYLVPEQLEMSRKLSPNGKHERHIQALREGDKGNLKSLEQLIADALQTQFLSAFQK